MFNDKIYGNNYVIINLPPKAISVKAVLGLYMAGGGQKEKYFMKKVCISLAFVLIIIVSAISFAGTGGQTEYVCIHIRANSDSKTDQSIKYEVRDLVVSYLTPYLENVETKEEATMVIENQKTAVKRLIDGLLIRKGFAYSSNVRINNEYFPTRKYEQETLSAGYYDAVIVELGNAEGANWWCVVYPPLCFGGEKVKYRSIIVEKLEELFS